MPDLVEAMARLIEATAHYSKRRALKPVERKLEKAMKKAFQAQSRAYMQEFKTLEEQWPVVEANRQLDPIGIFLLREAIDGGILDPLFDKAMLKTLQVFAAPLKAAMWAALQAGSKRLIADLRLPISFSLKNPRALAYLETHGAELVKQINETTREQLRHVVNHALDNGWSYKKTALSIQKRFAGYYDPGSWWNFDAPRPQKHIDSRAHLIAVTEAGNAYEEGNYIVVQDLADAGLKTEKFWSTMGDDRVSEGCRANEAEGWISSEQNHISGHAHPLRFPGCRCDEMYRVRQDAKKEVS